MGFLNVPWLRQGSGATPAEGGCIMQVIDWIDRNEWTDTPFCVHPLIRNLAIAANDHADDNERQQLLTLAPRMMGTQEVTWQVEEALEGWAEKNDQECMCSDCMADRGDLRTPLGLLLEVLDLFDQVSGRTEAPALDYSGVCAVMGAPPGEE